MKTSSFFFINNIKIFNIRKNINIIDYLESLNINIPHYCYHKKLSVAGNCRMCLVELKNAPKPIVSCSMTITNKMEIFTDSPLVKKARENVLEFLLINHPLDCPICDQGGECDLQDMSMSYGTSKKRFYNYKTGTMNKNLGPVVKTAMTRCIHCTRCVRFASEIAGIEDLGTFGRGSSTEIGTYVSKTFQSELSGNIIDICPVGALTSKPYPFVDRNWELKNFKGLDFSDGLASSITIAVKNQDVVSKILPDYDYKDETSNIWVSDKTRLSFDGMLSPTRVSDIVLKSLKSGNYSFIEKWDEIFKEIVSIIYFTHHLYRHKYKPFMLTIIAGNNVNMETLSALLLLEKKYSFIKIRKLDSTKFSFDHQNSFLLNKSVLKQKLNTSNFCLLFNLNTRFESSALNVIIRKRYLKGNFKLVTVNSLKNFTYPVKSLGTDTSVLKSLIEGNLFICQELLYAKNPTFISNTDLLIRNDGNSLLQAIEFLNNKILLPCFHNKDLSINILNSTLNEAGLYHLNGINNLTVYDMSASESGYYFIENNKEKILSKLVELKLNNFVIGNDTLGYPYGIEQNNNSEGLGNKLLQGLSKNIYLPSTTMFESSGTFFSSDGLYKRSVKILPSLNKSKDSWQIIRRLSSYLNSVNLHMFFEVSYSYKNLINLINYSSFIFFPVNNFNKPIYFFGPTEFEDFTLLKMLTRKRKKIWPSKTVSWIDDFYIGGRDLYSANSKIMIECSKNMRLSTTSFQYIV